MGIVIKKLVPVATGALKATQYGCLHLWLPRRRPVLLRSADCVRVPASSGAMRGSTISIKVRLYLLSEAQRKAHLI